MRSSQSAVTDDRRSRTTARVSRYSSAVRGRINATSISPAMAVIGVRSSCEASDAKRRCPSSAPCRRSRTSLSDWVISPTSSSRTGGSSLAAKSPRAIRAARREIPTTGASALDASQ